MTEQLPLPSFAKAEASFFPAIQTMNGFASMTLSGAAKSLAPVSRQSSAATSEVCALASRRLSAWAEHQKRLSTCRQPMDVAGAVQAFWVRAAEDYTSFGQASYKTWLAGWQDLMVQGQAAAKAVTSSVPVGRDVLNFKDMPESDAQETDPRRMEARTRAA